MNYLAYWSDSKDRFLIHHGSIKDTLLDWHEADGPLDTYDFNFRRKQIEELTPEEWDYLNNSLGVKKEKP